MLNGSFSGVLQLTRKNSILPPLTRVKLANSKHGNGQNHRKNRKGINGIHTHIPLIPKDMKRNVYLELIEYLLGVMKQQV